jgi:glycosyltransferase involved in cell wall biosynthesis
MPHSTFRPTVSIIIKALNEEKRIALAIESALAALGEVDGEVIVADGASTDSTVEIARGYPVRIVKLNDIAHRSCGAGAQLGFQYSRGRYVYLLDGDMQLHPEFLPAAVRHLEESPTVAGVGGLIVEISTANMEFKQRANRNERDRQPGQVTRLDCGGLYRRSAIESLGYFTDRNLHAGEEGELGARLRARGWTLERLALRAIDHCGHSCTAYQLLLQRVRSRFAFGAGEVARASFGRPHFRFVFHNNNTLKLSLLMQGWWAGILVCPLLVTGTPLALLTMTALIALPIMILGVRWRSINAGLYSFAAWNTYALFFLPGFLLPRASPTSWIDSTVVQDLSA